MALDEKIIMDRAQTLSKLISRDRGIEELEKYLSFNLHDANPLAESAKNIMQNVPPAFGSCAMLSAAWVATLNDKYNIPAVAVAGGLKIGEKNIFKCKKNIPEFNGTKRQVIDNWDGHCWIEVDGLIGDLSIFRTAYSIKGNSVLKNHIITNFGHGRGALLSPNEELISHNMKYNPKYILKENQINALLKGLEGMLK